MYNIININKGKPEKQNNPSLPELSMFIIYVLMQCYELSFFSTTFVLFILDSKTICNKLNVSLGAIMH